MIYPQPMSIAPGFSRVFGSPYNTPPKPASAGFFVFLHDEGILYNKNEKFFGLFTLFLRSHDNFFFFFAFSK
jgi:hypothetical protein